MRVGILRSLAALLTATGVVTAQAPGSGNGPGLSGQMMAAAPAQVAPAGPLPSYSPLAHPESWAPSGCSNCDSGDDCARPTYQSYGSAEFLLWNFRNDRLPRLASSVPVGLIQVPSVTTTSVTGPGAAAVVPPAGTGPTNIFIPVSIVSTPTFPGSGDLDPGDQLGARLTVGYWLDAAQQVGVEASGFYIHPRVVDFVSGTGNNSNQFVINTGLTAQTFFAPAVGGLIPIGGATPVAVPRQTTATIVGDARSQMLGGELNARCLGCSIGPVSFLGLAGARYLEFREGLNVQNTVQLTTPPGFMDPPGLAFPTNIGFSTFDSLTTRNRYYAPQVGVDVEVDCDGVFFTARGKVAVGVMQQIVDVVGQTTPMGFTLPSGGNAASGLLSSPIDQGRRDRTRVAVIPELNLKLGYQFNSTIRTYVGYDFLYLQHVIRPGNLSDLSQSNTQVTVADTTNTINVSQPVIRLRDQDVWVQGINLGVEFRY
ncbi:MAG: BBP7 family outer membrane beta-barrel protein [Planctomycetes bacterium]|nr:BBP7 family outer membrane beta-barrel protein [Planctomycetota bacterium]